MKSNTKAEAAPASGQQIMVTLHKGGTAEKTLPLSHVVIPDLWHIAQGQMDTLDLAAILECWHYAHDLKRTVEEIATDKAALLAALEDTLHFLEAMEYQPFTRYFKAQINVQNNQIRVAIAHAKGQP